MDRDRMDAEHSVYRARVTDAWLHNAWINNELSDAIADTALLPQRRDAETYGNRLLHMQRVRYGYDRD